VLYFASWISLTAVPDSNEKYDFWLKKKKKKKKRKPNLFVLRQEKGQGLLHHIIT